MFVNIDNPARRTYSKDMVSLIKRAFVFLLHPTASRTNGVLIILIILASIPLTVLFAQMHQQINQEAAPPPPPPSQPQNPAAFVYIEPFTIDGIQNKNTTQPKDKNITLYLYNLTHDPSSEPKETKVFKKLILPSNYDPASNTFSSSKFSLDNAPKGKYQLLLKIDGSLRQLIGIKDITASNETIIIQSEEVKLIMGDVNNDNELNILDYGLILDCFEDTVIHVCANKDFADLNFDGMVNNLDYDLFLKNLLVSKADKE